MPEADLLFLTPTLPNVRDRGLAIRAQHAARVLGRFYRLHLVVLAAYLRESAPVSVEGFASVTVVPGTLWRDLLHRFCPWWHCPAEVRFLTRQRLKEIRSRLGSIRFQRIYAHRLAMLPLALAFWDGSMKLDLDLDDLESRTRRELARLAWSRGRWGQALSLARDSRFCARQEQNILPRLPRVLVCSELDRQALGPSISGQVLPNVVVASPLEAIPGPRMELLFVGGLDYLPNWDAVVHLVEAVVPRLEAAGLPFRLTVVGACSYRLPRWVREHPAIHLAGFVERLEPYYQRATAALAPIRAGGGTRIKILEALAYGCPVVSTSKGTEGLKAPLMLAESPAELAEACVTLHRDEQRRAELARAGLAYVAHHHHPALLEPILLET